jgi:hypothetical protein
MKLILWIIFCVFVALIGVNLVLAHYQIVHPLVCGIGGFISIFGTFTTFLVIMHVDGWFIRKEDKGENTNG